MDPARHRAIRSAHAKTPHLCTCGRIVWGNGGEFNHKAMHARKGDGHRFTTSRDFYERFPNARGAPMLEGETLAEYQERVS